MDIISLTPEQIDLRLPELSGLLIDAVDGGASVSFIAPMVREDADRFWQGVRADVTDGSKIVWLALVEGQVAGCVHLAFATQPNGSHRAEIQKMLVHSAYRRRGLAKALLAAAEEHAYRNGRSLIVLDTEEGSVAEQLYARCGYRRVGVIPHFARSSGGALHGTTFFYKELGDGSYR